MAFLIKGRCHNIHKRLYPEFPKPLQILTILEIFITIYDISTLHNNQHQPSLESKSGNYFLFTCIFQIPKENIFEPKRLFQERNTVCISAN